MILNSEEVIRLKSDTMASEDIMTLFVGDKLYVEIHYDYKSGNYVVSANDYTYTLQGRIFFGDEGMTLNVDSMQREGTDLDVNAYAYLTREIVFTEISGERFDTGNATIKELLGLSYEKFKDWIF